MAREQRRERLCYACLLLLTVHLVFSNAQSWWSLGVSECGLRHNPRCDSCQELSDAGTLNTQQKRICQQQGDIGAIRAISQGSRDAIIDCQSRFEGWNWNCSTFFGQDLFGNFINDGTRETAVVYAYMNAGAMVGVAEACHDKQIFNCPCEVIGPVRKEDADGNIVFNECSDNVNWAMTFLQSFVDSSMTQVTPEDATDRQLMDKRNIEVGRQSVDNRRSECNCHGISGTCTVKTCYQKVPIVTEVGEVLRRRYDTAIKVRKSVTNTLQATVSTDDLTSDDLVFVQDSPNFCNSDMQRGILGTKDRLCDRTSQGPNGCSNLCCGRGFRNETYFIDVEECEFVWCCRIECNVVRRDRVVEYRCK